MIFSLFFLISFFAPCFPFQVETFLDQSDQILCSDYRKLTDFDSLVWPFPAKPIPWVLFPTTDIYFSPCFNNKFEAFFSKTIPGSNNITFKNFLQHLASNGCRYYPHGGFVRDLINSIYPHDLDGQYSCSREELLRICGGLFGPNFCSVDMNSSYFFIGNHSLEGFNWKDSFFSLKDQEFTPDSLYYDTLNKVLIDLSGKGFEDVTKKQIRIPVERNDWDQWLLKETDDSIRRFYGLKKVPRYWKLKENGFKDYDNITLNYLKVKIRYLWNNQRFPMKKIFMKHVCWILDGSFDEISKNSPTVCLPKLNQFEKNNVEKCKSFLKSINMDFWQNPGRILKDLNKFVRGTGCFSKKFSGKLFLFFVLSIFLNLIWF